MMRVEAAGAGVEHVREYSFLRVSREWLMTVEPRRIAQRHAALGGLFAAIAVLAALLLRLELTTPALDSLSSHSFGTLLSLHGSLMMYFVALPLFPGVLGHTLLLRVLGREQTDFPRLARASWHFLASGGLIVLVAFLCGGTEAGWMFDAEFGGHFLFRGSLALAIGVLFAAMALLSMALNAVVTIWTSRRHAFPAGQFPFVAAMLLANLMLLLITPPLVVCMLLVVVDRCFGVALFGAAVGIDPRLFSALFRSFSAPALHLLLLCALGTAWSVLAARLKAPPRGRHLPLACGLILVAGVCAGAAPACKTMGALPAYSAASLLATLVLPAICLFLVSAARGLRRGLVRFDTAAAFALGFMLMAAIAGGTMALMALPVPGGHLESTTFASGHLHLLLTGVLGMAFLAGLHEVWTDIAGRAPRGTLGQYAAAVIFAGTLCTFVPLLILGLRGASFRANAYPAEFQVLQTLSTAGATILCTGVILAIGHLRLAGRLPRAGG